MTNNLSSISPIKLSVLMITFNHEKYIKQAIESVLMQKTNFIFEILIGEDSSSDNTRFILQEYERKYPALIKLISNDKNLGAQVNFLNTYKNCRGEYVAILEGDDYWTDPFKLQRQVDYLDSHPNSSISFTNSIIVDELDHVIKRERVPEDKRKNLSQREIVAGYCPPSNTVLFRNNLLGEFPPEYFSIVNGDFFLFSLLTSFGDAGYLDFNTAAYRKHNNGAWSGKSEEYVIRNYIKTCRAILNALNNIHEDILKESILNSSLQLLELGRKEMFTDNGYWTPQTKMLQSIRDYVFGLPLNLKTGLSIDDNPTLEKIVSYKWPEIEIRNARYPQFDAQNLYQFDNNQFDIVFSHQVLEHIPKPWIAAKELVRVLKPGGIGIHTSCAFNPRHGVPAFNDYYRFLPDGLTELFDGVKILVKDEWGNRDAILYNAGVNDGHGVLGGRRFVQKIGERSDGLYPWHTWVIFQKN